MDDWTKSGGPSPSRNSVRVSRRRELGSSVNGGAPSELQSITSKLTKLAQTINDYEEASKMLGSSNDGNSLRSRLRELRYEAKSLCEDVNSSLKEVSTKNPKGRIAVACGKLRRDYTSTFGRFTQLNEQTLVKERRIVSEMRERAESRRTASTESTDFTAIQLSADDIDVELLKERNLELAQVEKEAKEIKTLFQDVQALVVEQGEMVNIVSETVDGTGQNVEKGVQHLDDAYKYALAYRKKMAICISLAVLVIIAVILIALHETGQL